MPATAVSRRPIPRRRGALRIAPPRTPARTLAKIALLVGFTAGAAALAAATAVLGLLMVATKIGG